MEENKLTIATICGSLRKDSFNRKVLNAIERIAPEHWEFDHTNISTIPLYNADILYQWLSLKKAFEKLTVF
nr:NAD(P)H-dependent oxidoreductase [Lederbergia citrisecunda]